MLWKEAIIMTSKKRADFQEEIEITESSGNVYADVGHPNSQEALAKAELAMLIADVIKRKKLTQAKAAVLMGIDQPKVSLIIRGKLSGFTIERLFRFLMALGMDIFIEAKPHRSRITQPTIHVIPSHSSFSKEHSSATAHKVEVELRSKLYLNL